MHLHRATATFAAELARIREEQGFTQTPLATRLNVHRSLISHIECEKKVPSKAIADALDQVFGLTATRHFGKLYEAIVYERGSFGWLEKWREIEIEAVWLQCWDPLLIPGFLQTYEYARAVIGYNPFFTPEEVEEHTRRRIGRRAMFDRESPPNVTCLIDECALHRPIGSPHILVDQLRFLLEWTERPRLTIQIVPMQAGNAAGTSAAFQLAKLPTGQEFASVDSLLGAECSTNPEMVAKVKIWYEAIRADALSRRDTIELLRAALTQWTNKLT
ncbi:hypothetical protein DP939_04170 [Spongiactinospora rosea]|uniref:HTH cro/C1-type domain-containing protein n=1 Tax=Spongiactinospora rosea TaxID=2248750 RepID=A0A366M758_9ACTN|nr:helix-turn-helix transcriptional regulator [Spongiactinospora rosea]RBQ21877.1 hypothetical protein DP939_04170 [Spongiactinospora rosea]